MRVRTPEQIERDRESKRRHAINKVRRNRAAFFNGKSCVKCGSTEQLELDHIDPAQKTEHRIWTWSPERRAEELAKCQVLCHDCHQKKTSAERAARVKCGTEWAYRKGCRCDECREIASIRRRERKERKQQAEIDQIIRAGRTRATSLDWLDEALDKIA